VRRAPQTAGSLIRYATFPRTQSPPAFAEPVVEVFRKHEPDICTALLAKGLTSDVVLRKIADDLRGLGFEVERGKVSAGVIRRPVFFGENGKPALQYQVDCWHAGWRCGLEVEAGRALEGNAVYRDLIQALVMVDMEHLVLAVPLGYRRMSLGRPRVSGNYDLTCAVADALFGHSRVRMPYSLVIIGY
jgi:hypothetical protein